jgi:methionyl-tRNA formyltransferase
MVDSIVFAGTPLNAAQTLIELVSNGIEVSLVITRPDAPKGRKAVVTESPVAIAARELGLNILKANSIDDEAIVRIQETQSQVGVVVAYGSILRSGALGALAKGWYNLHYSLLPQLRGAAPVQHAIIGGLRETGVTLFKLDAGVDTGEYISQLKTKIEPGETAGRLLSRLTALGGTLVLQELPGIFAGTSVLQTQQGVPTRAPKLSRNDARLDFSREASELEFLVLGCNPEPGAWANLNGQPIKIHDAFAVATREAAPEGAVFEHGAEVAIRCANDTALVIRQVQPSGKTSMSAQDWRRGASEFVRFE